jgi:hypothetical protein
LAAGRRKPESRSGEERRGFSCEAHAGASEEGQGQLGRSGLEKTDLLQFFFNLTFKITF